jgi:hypothetical protein
MDSFNELKTSYPRVPKPRAITKPTRAQQDLRRFARQQNIGQSRIIQPHAQRNQPLSADERLIFQQDDARKQAAADQWWSSVKFAGDTGGKVAAVGWPVAKGAYRVGVDAYNSLVNTADLAADAMPTGPVPRTVPAPAPTIINNHYHLGEPARQGVSRMIDNVVHDSAYSAAQALATQEPARQGVSRMIANVVHDSAYSAAQALATQVLAGTAVALAPAAARVGVRAVRRATRKPKPVIEPRPAEARGGDKDAPRPGSADGQLPAGADEPTRPPPGPLNHQARVALYMQELRKRRNNFQ